jgi:predicted CoA-substrate-specific enzyme activase
MHVHIGLDIGAVGIKAAVLLPAPLADDVLARPGAVELWQRLGEARDGRAVLVTTYRRTRGRPLDAAQALLGEVVRALPAGAIERVACTGSGAAMVAERLGAATCNDFQACARGVDLLHPQVRTVFELGGETSRYLRLEPDPGSGRLGIQDYGANGDCAAGTGAFLDQQAGRLRFAVEDIGAVVAATERAAQIAGRCSVFAKSDMIHAQQKGYSPGEVLHGLCDAVAVNYKSAVVKGRAPVAPVALVGGVAANGAVVAALREVFGLDEAALFVPPGAAALSAVGAAVSAAESTAPPAADLERQLRDFTGVGEAAGYSFPRTQPLTLERVRILRDRVRPYELTPEKTPVDAYLGVDIGSVGTKLALIDAAGEGIHTIFTRTEGRPIEVVTRILRELEEAVGWGVRVCGVGTTGSGRELIGELIGADSINDEITAHKTGATFIGDGLLGRRPDTIFEIGGQDSKYISLQREGATGDPIVVDFTMNEACAVGTGSFLEERAEELGVAIKDEFAAEAFRSTAPIRLGERCTVFMERDVATCMTRGAERADIIAGLAFSIAYNYINRVVRGRPIGQTVFFQGGTAYNDAVAAAFSLITDKEIIVPPHNAVLGAIGAALLARDKVRQTGAAPRFRGYDLGAVEYDLREFTCHGCGNHCAIQEFDVEGEKTYWGDKCSDRFRKRAKTGRPVSIPDLVKLRRELLAADEADDVGAPRGTIGLPMAMYTWELLPLWRRLLRDCGFRVVCSDDTNRRIVQMGLDCAVAEPCFPIIVAHGHVAELVERGVDYVWLPNMVAAPPAVPDKHSFYCPWGMTLPYIVRQAPSFRHWGGRILCPTIRFDDGMPAVQRTLVETLGALGVPRRQVEAAYAAGLAAQEAFRTAYQQAGAAALAELNARGEEGMVLIGRPYNIHDVGVSLAVARKLRELYGVNVLPIDALPLDPADLANVDGNMYWSYGRRILAAAQLVRRHPNLHIIYVTNFKCGPDSYIKSYIRDASGKPFLTLQFDGHSNDAGMMTRCEAYLDSKGILRWWRTCRSQPTDAVLPDAPSTSPRWPSPLPG